MPGLSVTSQTTGILQGNKEEAEESGDCGSSRSWWWVGWHKYRVGKLQTNSVTSCKGKALSSSFFFLVLEDRKMLGPWAALIYVCIISISVKLNFPWIFSHEWEAIWMQMSSSSRSADLGVHSQLQQLQRNYLYAPSPSTGRAQNWEFSLISLNST